jgi:hypothetical protein
MVSPGVLGAWISDLGVVSKVTEDAAGSKTGHDFYSPDPLPGEPRKF